MVEKAKETNHENIKMRRLLLNSLDSFTSSGYLD